LLATGPTKEEALKELESALIDWIDLALRRGAGLPASKKVETELVSAR
jgi:predicted RNase H-like HicB family nuclease